MIPLTFLTYNQLGLFANREKEYVEIVLSSNKKGIMPFFWEKVYITASPMGGGLHNPQPMKRSILPLELFKTGQIIP